MEIVCTDCYFEDCFFNGVEYECPNCGKKWDPECGFMFYDEYNNDDWLD